MPNYNECRLEGFLKNIQKQFLCCYPLHCISWQDFPMDLSWEQQSILMDHTFRSSFNIEFPIKLSYQLNFLKKILLLLEKNCTEVHDVVYEIYCQIQQNLANDCTEQYAFKHYIIKSDIHITLWESKSFVVEGTTGLCSWQASLALADFLLKHPNITRSKSVLELGAGTGLCGLIVLKMCQPRHLLLSDGNSSCVELMRQSLKRNFPEVLEEDRRFVVDTQVVECSVVPWECIEDIGEVASLKPDIIIAADVVYDDSCFGDLSSAIDYVFRLKENRVEMYLAVTVRNESTLNGFLRILESLNFYISECNVVPEKTSHLYWDRSTPVKILKLSR